MLYLSPNNSVVVLIDWQERLAPVMPEAIERRNRAATRTLLAAAVQLEVPIVVSEQYPKGLGSTVPELLEVLPGETQRHEKRVFSAAEVPGFQDELAQTGRSHVIVAGMEAHICVYQTVRALREEGYSVHVPLNAVVSRYKHDYMAAVGLYRHVAAAVTSVETVLFDWLRRAEGDNFKAISGLIR